MRFRRRCGELLADWPNYWPKFLTGYNYREANRALWRQAILPLAGAILSGLAQGLAGWFEGASLSVDINRVTALAEERQMLWAMAASADFLDPAEKRQMVGLS